MSRQKKLLQICFLFAFIYMMMCPVVHALHDRYVGNAVFNFPLHSIVQKYAGDLTCHQDYPVYALLPDYAVVKSVFSQNLPILVFANPSNNLSIVTTIRLNL
ncbi:MAG: hypothetical protein NTV89_08025 [Proteobacteria bacterium]|nr:hypothetical protein [Pseudomonadota bacterium]